jgi:hypothetical protein
MDEGKNFPSFRTLSAVRQYDSWAKFLRASQQATHQVKLRVVEPANKVKILCTVLLRDTDPFMTKCFSFNEMLAESNLFYSSKYA